MLTVLAWIVVAVLALNVGLLAVLALAYRMGSRRVSPESQTASQLLAECGMTEEVEQ